VRDAVPDAVTENDPLADQLHEVSRRLHAAEAGLTELREHVDRLDHDLDESRRLNLRAAELLDLVYVHLAGKSGFDRPAFVRSADEASPSEGTLS
jgi:hypothetical protein